MANESYGAPGPISRQLEQTYAVYDAHIRALIDQQLAALDEESFDGEEALGRNAKIVQGEIARREVRDELFTRRVRRITSPPRFGV